MMKELEIGAFVTAEAGHDSGKIYVIFLIEDEYLYLVDGNIRTLDRPKKKKMMHVKMQALPDSELTAKIKNGRVKNEEIKRAIKLLQNGNSSKEA